MQYPPATAENSLAGVMVIVASAIISIVQLRSWKVTTDLTGQIAGLKAALSAIPTAVALQVARALSGVDKRMARHSERLTSLEAICRLRHAERKAEMSDMLHKGAGD